MVELMRQVNAPIGGEGNGGVGDLSELHYGRDALVGIALFLTLLAKRGLNTSSCAATGLLHEQEQDRTEARDGRARSGERHRNAFKGHPTAPWTACALSSVDQWVHLRRSNTEPIVRIYAENNLPGTRMRWPTGSWGRWRSWL